MSLPSGGPDGDHNGQTAACEDVQVFRLSRWSALASGPHPTPSAPEIPTWTSLAFFRAAASNGPVSGGHPP
jgi:hypothetical protein